MGRPAALTPRLEQQLAAMLSVGVRQELAGRAVGVSRRTVCRFVARRRRDAAPQTLEEVLRSVPTLDEVLGQNDRPPRRRRRRAPKLGWEEAARVLEAEAPERWAPPGVS